MRSTASLASVCRELPPFTFAWLCPACFGLHGACFGGGTRCRNQEADVVPETFCQQLIATAMTEVERRSNDQFVKGAAMTGAQRAVGPSATVGHRTAGFSHGIRPQGLTRNGTPCQPWHQPRAVTLCPRNVWPGARAHTTYTSWWLAPRCSAGLRRLAGCWRWQEGGGGHGHAGSAGWSVGGVM